MAEQRAMKFIENRLKIVAHNLGELLLCRKDRKHPNSHRLHGSMGELFYTINWGEVDWMKSPYPSPLFIDITPYNGVFHNTNKMTNGSLRFGTNRLKIVAKLCDELRQDPKNYGIWDFSSLFLKILGPQKSKPCENIGSKCKNKNRRTNVKKLSRPNTKRPTGTVCKTGGDQ